MLRNTMLIGAGASAVLGAFVCGTALGSADTLFPTAGTPSATTTVTVTETAAPLPAKTRTVVKRIKVPGPTVTKRVEVPGPTVVKRVEVPGPTVTVVPAPEQDTAVPEPAPDTGGMTTAQQNAVGSAQGYLDHTHFSRKGLIEQLVFEGYSRRDATRAVDSLSVNYKDQAAGSARSYLESSHFSRKGLIEQLEYEGYTRAQAEYGVRKTGL